MMDLPGGGSQARGPDAGTQQEVAVTGGDSATIELDGHRIALTHLRKVLYPATGTTKSAIIAYFAEVAHAMIPHLAGRAVTRKRGPDGVTTTPFLHKDLPRGTPSWVT